MTGYVWRGQQPAGTVLCACGCGEPVPLAAKTDRRYGTVRGKPRRFISGHNPTPGQDMAAAHAALAARRAEGDAP